MDFKIFFTIDIDGTTDSFIESGETIEELQHNVEKWFKEKGINPNQCEEQWSEPVTSK